MYTYVYREVDIPNWSAYKFFLDFSVMNIAGMFTCTHIFCNYLIILLGKISRNRVAIVHLNNFNI